MHFALFIFHSRLIADSRDPFVYDEYVNVPFGLDHYEGRLFIAIPRRNPGIPATLNVLKLKDLTGRPPHLNPRLEGYPSFEMNSLSVRIIIDSTLVVESEANIRSSSGIKNY